MSSFDPPFKPLRDDPELTELIAWAREYVKSLTPEQFKAMLQAQAESWARANVGVDEGTRVTLDPQPRQPLKTADEMVAKRLSALEGENARLRDGYTAGFRAGIEAAAKHLEDRAAVYEGAAKHMPDPRRDQLIADLHRWRARDIRSLKPEANDG